VSVICCHNMWPTHKFDLSPRWESLEPITAEVPNPPRPGLITRCLFGLRYRTTDWTAWTASVVGLARKLHRTRPFDAVMSRSHPWHAHIPGYWVASDLRIPWLANLNDPWDVGFFLADQTSRADWRSWNSRRWRRHVLSRADLVTFPCQRLRDFSLRDCPRATGVRILPHIGGMSRSSAQHPQDVVVVHA